jgi:4a-hydroxytetrahydrobiopterin dehydratase
MPSAVISDLVSKRCQACAPGTAPVAESRVREVLRELPGWEGVAGGKEIAKTYKFANYHETMAFVNATAWISHREDHHPDLEVGYNRCRVRYSTHSIGGVSENDLICAAKVESLVTPGAA